MQTFIANQAASYLSNRLNTTVKVDKVSIDFFDKINLQGVFIADSNKDTLLYTNKLGIQTTNWFFLQKNPTIEEVVIDGGKINLWRKRESDQWNYDYIIQAFKNDKTSSKDNKNTLPKWNLDKIKLANIDFNYIDQWIGTDYFAKIGAFEIIVNKIDWKNKTIDINTIESNKVLIGINEYTGGRPAHLKKPKKPYSFKPFNPEQWEFAVHSLKLNDNRFILDHPEKPLVANKFDERHLDINNIHLNANAIKIIGDTIFGEIKDLKAKDRSGLAINAMQALVKVSPNIAECKQLFLKTDYSELKHYYAMHYEKFPDFLQYIKKVQMKGNLSGSVIGFNDIIYFTDELDFLKDKTVLFTGKAEGTVEHLKSDNIVLFDGINKWVGDITLLGIPDMDAFFIESKTFNLNTSSHGVLHYFPLMAHQNNFNIHQLKAANISGNFAGLINNFNTDLKIGSNFGDISIAGNVKNVLTNEISYDLNAITNKLQLNEMLHTDVLGHLTINSNIKGTLKNGLNNGLSVVGDIAAIEISKYEYKNIHIDGVFNQLSFDGKIDAKDENFSAEMNGSVDYSELIPHYKVDAQIHHIDLNKLGIANNKIQGSGELNVDFRGKKMDDFIGTALLYNLYILDDTQKLQIDQLYLSASHNFEGQKTINIVTNGLQARMTGLFNLEGLPKSLSAFLHTYIPNYIRHDATIPLQQKFIFDIQGGDVSPLIRLLNLPIEIDSGFSISGSFDNSNQVLNVDGLIKGFEWNNFNGKEILLAANTNDKGFYTNMQLKKFKYADYEIASSLNFKSNILNDAGVFNISTSSENTLGDALISGNVVAKNDSLFLNINQSNFFFNHKKWAIQQGNSVLFVKDGILIKDLLLHSDKQKIAINNNLSEWNEAHVSIENIELSPVNNMIGFDNVNIQGVVNGEFIIKNLLDSIIVVYDLNAPATTVDSIKFGSIQAEGSVDVYNGIWNIGDGSYITYEQARGQVFGSWNYHKEIVDLNIDAQKLPLVWMQPFTKGYIHNISGTSNFDIKIVGNRLNPNVEGNIQLKNASVTPDITGVAYQIKDGEIKVDNMYFTLIPFQVYDEYNNVGTLSGSIMHNGLSKLDFSLNFASDQILALNLNKFQGDYFYGNIIAKANVSLRGLVDNVSMNIIGTPLKNSKLYIPIKSESDYSMYNYIQFKKHDDSNKVFLKPKRIYNYNLRIDAIATKDLEAIIILDEETNDQLQTKGYGNLTLEIPSDGDMRLNGVYVIEEGTYNFAFKQLEILNYKRQFIIDPQSSIKWNGDLYDADLDISAYTQVKARLYDLILNETDRIALTRSELSDAQLTQLFNVKMNMIGRLSQPNLKFNIATVENRSIGTYAYQKLQRINADERELLNQVTGLLLLGQFIPPEGFNASASNASISAGAITNMSEMLSTVASSQISNFANKLLGIEDLYIGLRYKNYAMAGIDPLNPTSYTNRNEAGFNVRKNFLNNRLIAEVGGVYDWGVQKASGSLSDNIAGDFRIQYSLSSDGSIRMKLFRTSSYDAVLQQNIGRHGAGIIYKKSFTTFSDLFKRRKFYLLNLSDSTSLNK